ncbi:MAG TPA: murein L,D-transpeptidase catalytic domain family protein, partial [Gemmatimonadales bacterium]
RPLLTVIDYSLRSREPRLWVLDLAAGRVVARELVAHGRGTGGDEAREFSNRPGSHQSSLGTFLTGATYRGKHGVSLRLKGLDRGLNHLAEARAIVIHGAEYVDQAIVRQLGRLGRSQGCPALSRSAAPRVIDLIRDGTVVFSYHPSAALDRVIASR